MISGMYPNGLAVAAYLSTCAVKALDYACLSCRLAFHTAFPLRLCSTTSECGRVRLLMYNCRKFYSFECLKFFAPSCKWCAQRTAACSMQPVGQTVQS
jgi:hypothetical protein